MKKSILNFEKAVVLTETQQKEIVGKGIDCHTVIDWKSNPRCHDV